MVGLPRLSVRSWRWSATFPAAVGRAGTSEGVRGCLRVEAERTAPVGGLGVAGIDGRGRVLWARGVSSWSWPCRLWHARPARARAGLDCGLLLLFVGLQGRHQWSEARVMDTMGTARGERVQLSMVG